jgi:hypothetical protein
VSKQKRRLTLENNHLNADHHGAAQVRPIATPRGWWLICAIITFTAIVCIAAAKSPVFGPHAQMTVARHHAPLID